MNASSNTLATPDHWAERWAAQEAQVEFDPHKPFFAELHDLFRRTLPRGESVRCLEVGCYPGTYLWYFHKYFGHRVTGIEYVQECARRCETLMHARGVPADIRHADLFDYKVPGDEEGWDVVVSFGFIEHFDAVTPVVQKHLDLLKPGGYLVLVIPNHAGINGSILKAVDLEKYKTHNCMDYAAMKNAVLQTGQADILEGGYYGRLGFWNTGLYPVVLKYGRWAYRLVRAPLYVLEGIAQRLLPNSRRFSPNAALIARKHGGD